MIFVNKNWLNDARIRCNSFFNSIKLIVTNTDLEEKFKKFEIDDVLEIWWKQDFCILIKIY